jgi:hypothetical protein
MTSAITLGPDSSLMRFGVPFPEYSSSPSLNISKLKVLKRSPLHFLYECQHPKPSTRPRNLGTATHTAILEPERFKRDYAVYEGGIRRGKAWDAFVEQSGDRMILTPSECEAVTAMSTVVLMNAIASRYLEGGSAEVTMEWQHRGRRCKGRVDYLTTVNERDYIVGLKTARDCRPFIFGSQAARLSYHLQWAWYRDGFVAVTGRVPALVEIVVESSAPHAVAVYEIPSDVIEQGREEYTTLLDVLEECERDNSWPGPVQGLAEFTLPTWAYDREGDDLSELGLEIA